MTDLILILTTMPAGDRADGLARTLVEERLAACVNIHAPMTSVYRWQGQIEIEPERQVVIKTTRAQLAAIEARLRVLHPYDVPEFVVMNVEAGGAYGEWVADATTP